MASATESLVDRIGRESGGYAIEDKDGSIYIPVLWMRKPGTGEGSAFLDSLPRDRTIKVPGVMSARLRGMLERRGFRPESEWAPEFGEYVEVYVRRPDV